MESTAQVPCTLSLPGTPPTALVKRMNFAQALDHVPAAEVQLVGSTGKQHVLNNWRPALPPFPRGISYMCTCVLLYRGLPFLAGLNFTILSICGACFSGHCVHFWRRTADASPKSVHNFTCQGSAPSETDVTTGHPNKDPPVQGSPNSSPFALRLLFHTKSTECPKRPAGQAARPIVPSSSRNVLRKVQV